MLHTHTVSQKITKTSVTLDDDRVTVIEYRAYLRSVDMV